MKMIEVAVCATFVASLAANVAFAETTWYFTGGVKASSFGWNATNATKCLQAAFDSGSAKVVIDRQAGEWIVEPVFLRSNQEVVIEDGVVVRALKGAYKSPNDCLFTVRGVSNVVLRGVGCAILRMERDAYTDRKEYRFSEWRHTLNIISSANVRVSDLAFRHSGGDGIYVGGHSSDIDIRHVDCRDHYRHEGNAAAMRHRLRAEQASRPSLRLSCRELRV